MIRCAILAHLQWDTTYIFGSPIEKTTNLVAFSAAILRKEGHFDATHTDERIVAPGAAPRRLWPADLQCPVRGRLKMRKRAKNEQAGELYWRGIAMRHLGITGNYNQLPKRQRREINALARSIRINQTRSTRGGG